MDVQKVDQEWNAVVSCYFNPIGTHICGRISENPNGIPNNQIIYIFHIVVRNSVELFLGGGQRYSVPDMVNVFDKVNGVEVPYSIKPRRAGDIAICYCDPAKAKAELGWEAQFGIEEMVWDSWNWQRGNPEGYKSLIK